MDKPVVLSLAMILRRAAVGFYGLLRGLIFRLSSRVMVGKRSPITAEPRSHALGCRIRVTHEVDGYGKRAFVVGIRGVIHSAAAAECASARIALLDITRGPTACQPVHSRLEQWRTKNSPQFSYSADLGRIPEGGTTLSDWVAIAAIDLDWLVFARKGTRNLRLSVSIVSRDSGEELTCAECDFMYDNTAFGYVDAQENIQRVRTLAVALAFAVSAADSRLYDCEVAFIKEWARSHIDVSAKSERAQHAFEKALDKTVEFFRGGNQLDAYGICKEIAEIAPVGERYDVLELCLRTAQAKGIATAVEVELLKKLADWLAVDMDKFRTMLAKILPANMHEAGDIDVILGVTADMGRENVRRRLNDEYRKWNARVISRDPQVQTQADLMLQLIAEARSEYMA